MNCPTCKSANTIKNGTFYRTSDKRCAPRFYCKDCNLGFSERTGHPCYRQKKAYLNKQIFQSAASCVSQRRMALTLKVNRKTIARKIKFLGHHCLVAIENNKHLFSLGPIKVFAEIQFDEMETFEHTKYKPLSIPLAVEAKTRRILAFDVAIMPANGLLAKKSVAKYGKRPDERAEKCLNTLKRLAPFLTRSCTIASDQNPRYPVYIKEALPLAQHQPTPGARGCITGQGELKNLAYDPLFWFNHTAAMFRANINRLVRKTWCTTKLIEGLRHHIAIYIWYHNNYLLHPEFKHKQAWQIYPELSRAMGYLR